MPATLSKTFRIPRQLHARLAARAVAERLKYAQTHRKAPERRLAQITGIDMAAALHDFIGVSEGTGRSQADRKKRFGRRAQRTLVLRRMGLRYRPLRGL